MLGVASTLAAAALLVRPELTNSLSGVVAIVESQDPKRLLLLLGSVVGAYAAWAARASSPSSRSEDGPTARFDGDDPPEAVSAADRIRTGESFDARIEAACSGDEKALAEVRSTLAETATNAYARAIDSPPAEARRAVETGAWTEDPTAAAFLAGDGGPGFSLWSRLRAWLDPAAEERRRVERTVEAVSRVLQTEGHGSEANGTEASESDAGESGDGESETDENRTAGIETGDSQADRGGDPR
jgi:hypothetical protein